MEVRCDMKKNLLLLLFFTMLLLSWGIKNSYTGVNSFSKDEGNKGFFGLSIDDKKTIEVDSNILETNLIFKNNTNKNIQGTFYLLLDGKQITFAHKNASYKFININCIKSLNTVIPVKIELPKKSSNHSLMLVYKVKHNSKNFEEVLATRNFILSHEITLNKKNGSTALCAEDIKQNFVVLERIKENDFFHGVLLNNSSKDFSVPITFESQKYYIHVGNRNNKKIKYMLSLFIDDIQLWSFNDTIDTKTVKLFSSKNKLIGNNVYILMITKEENTNNLYNSHIFELQTIK